MCKAGEYLWEPYQTEDKFSPRIQGIRIRFHVLQIDFLLERDTSRIILVKMSPQPFVTVKFKLKDTDWL